MTEEELAASLGLIETDEMKALRPDILRLAPQGEEEASVEFNDTWLRYECLGEVVADSIESDSGRIGLILLSASLWRDLVKASKWEEDMEDAFVYADNALTDPSIAEAIRQLLAAGPVLRNN